MKKILLLSLLIIAFSCNSDDDLSDQNPYLNPPPTNTRLDLNLPQYDPLKFPGNSVVINGGVRGIVVYNVNNDLYTAFDLSDPNHSPNNCSQMLVEGTEATCQCEDGNTYNLITGEHTSNPQTYPMLFYRVQRSGDVITVSN